MKNATLLREYIREVLANNCTGMDDHHSEPCPKCEDMEEDLITAIENWRLRAYKITKRQNLTIPATPLNSGNACSFRP